MTEADVLQTVRKHLESRFPKTCPSCGRRFDTLREFIQTTRRLGPAILYDAELGNWNTEDPIGCQALANCPCGSTLALGTDEMPVAQRVALLAWMRVETRRRGVSPSELLESLRDKIHCQVLDADENPDP